MVGASDFRARELLRDAVAAVDPDQHYPGCGADGVTAFASSGGEPAARLRALCGRAKALAEEAAALARDIAADPPTHADQPDPAGAPGADAETTALVHDLARALSTLRDEAEAARLLTGMGAPHDETTGIRPAALGLLHELAQSLMAIQGYIEGARLLVAGAPGAADSRVAGAIAHVVAEVGRTAEVMRRFRALLAPPSDGDGGGEPG